MSALEGLADCTACPLREHGRPVGGKGNVNASVMVVGEAPGRTENDTGIPFVGRAGQALDELLKLAGVSPDDVYVTNTVKCWPPLDTKGKQKAPTVKQIRTCTAKWLAGEIAEVKPRIVLALGAVPVSHLLPGEKLTESHGRPFERDGRVVVPMYHPAAAMHDPRKRPVIDDDFRALKARLTGDSGDAPRYKLITTWAGLDFVVRKVEAAIAKGETVALDFETDSIRASCARLVGIALAFDGGCGFYLPCGHKNLTTPWTTSDLLRTLRPVWTQARVLAHNAKYEMEVLRAHGESTGVFDDSMMMAALLGKELKGLKPLALAECGVRMAAIDTLIGKGKSEITMVDVPVQDAAPYASADAAMTWRLTPTLWQQMDESDRWIYENVERPLVPIVTEMESEGIAIDRQAVAAGKHEIQESYERQVAALQEATGRPKFNPISPPQTVALLGTPDSEADTLLESDHPLARLVVEARHTRKLLGYLNALEVMGDRAFASFNQMGAENARFSASGWKIAGKQWGLNLQTMPKPKPWEDSENPESKLVRRCLVADPGCVLVEADFSQIELRIAAHLSQDAAMMQAYLDKRDIHDERMRSIGMVKSDTNRRIAKIVNFGTLYEPNDRSAAKVVKRNARKAGINLSDLECLKIVQTSRQSFPGILDYYNRVNAEVVTRGYVETVLGRKFRTRYVAGFGKVIKFTNEAILREAINIPISGSAADLLKLSLLMLDRSRPVVVRYKATVHDSVVFQCPQGRERETAEWAVECMSKALMLSVPIEVDVTAGPNWAEMEPVCR